MWCVFKRVLVCFVMYLGVYVYKYVFCCVMVGLSCCFVVRVCFVIDLYAHLLVCFLCSICVVAYL